MSKDALAGFGVALLAAVGAASLATGLPVFAVLIGAAMIGGAVSVASGAVPFALLEVLPSRVLALLENDLLQALPLYVLMGALIERMQIAPSLLSALSALFGGGKRAPLAPIVLLGALTGPMNGSVSANVLAVARSAGPLLAAAGPSDAVRLATVAVAGTLGMVVPPSLVLILLGDAMMAAHTIAANATGRLDRIINTQDVFRAALLPAGLFISACSVIAWAMSGERAVTIETKADAARAKSRVTALATVGVLGGLLAGVASGRLYAVEAAATGALLLLVLGFATGALRGGGLSELLSETLVTTGALFAPLVAATTFTLVLRMLGSDKLVAGWLMALPGSDTLAVVLVLGVIAIATLVLDAFEIIFVVVPIAVPPLLMRVTDAAWVAALVLLTLQASFLLPPAGYALLMTRKALGIAPTTAATARGLAPYLAALAAVIALVVAEPRLVHLTGATAPAAQAPPSSASPSQPAPDFTAPVSRLDNPALSGPPSFK